MYDSRSFTSRSLRTDGATARPTPQLAADLIAAWNDHAPERIAAFYAPDFEGDDIAQPQPQRGPGGIRRITAYYFRAFPDLEVELDDLIVQGDRAVLLWTWRGTHRGTFMRIPPTGRVVAVRGTTALTIEGGLIRRSSRMWDLAGLLRGLGLLPEL